MSEVFESDYEDDEPEDKKLPANTDDKKNSLSLQGMAENDIKDLLIQNILLLSQTSMTTGAKVDQNSTDIKELDGRMTVIEQRIEDNRMEHSQETKIYESVHKRIADLLGGKGSPDFKRYAPTLYKRLWGELNHHFSVTTYKDIRESDFEKALGIVMEWYPAEGMSEFKERTDRQNSYRR